MNKRAMQTAGAAVLTLLVVVGGGGGSAAECRVSHGQRPIQPHWTSRWVSPWILRRGRMRGGPIGRCKRNRKRISSPGVSSG